MRKILLVCPLALCCAVSHAVVVNVSVFSFGYGEVPGISSDPLIEVGDTVHWIWNSNFHTVTSAEGQAETYVSGLLNGGATFDHTFTNVGPSPYYCDLHGADLGGGVVTGMAGRIYVGNTSLIESFGIVRGTLSSGGTAELGQSDDQYMIVRKGLVLNQTEAPIQVTFDSVPVVGTPVRMIVRLEDGINTSGLSRRIELGNVNTGLLEQVEQSGAQLADKLTTVKVTGDVARFIDPVTRRVRVKVSYFATGPVGNANYQARFDRLVVVTL